MARCEVLAPRQSNKGDRPMLDTIFVAAGFGMFVVGVMYVFACDRL
jgi:hypothetical protein